MKISYNWLKEYINTSLSATEIGNILTSTGLEVESVEKVESIKGGLHGVVVGEVLTCTKHADADKLKVTTVSIGSGEELQIVCGAPNVAAGQKVLVATVGATLYPTPEEALKIKKSKIRGVESHGMICAEDELGLGTSHEGIMVLPADTKTGISAREYFSIEDDYLLEIGLTPNRSDAMSHIGVARDLKAYLNYHQNAEIKLNIPESVAVAGSNSQDFNFTIESPDQCPRYSVAVIEGVKITESPAWLQNRLRSIGLKPINNAVDITNFVMHECGNPLHAFDLDKSGNQIKIRNAKPGEKIRTLDLVERELSPQDLVICNDHPLCIAGVMGGADSGISNSTTQIFLEAACFDSTSVRKTSKRHQLFSDSSFRFERGVDPNNVIQARNRAISLILQICGGQLIFTGDSYTKVVMPEKVILQPQNLRNLIGTDLGDSDIAQILTELEFGVNKIADKNLEVTIPTYRYDVKRPADLTEEVLRIYGFDKVEIPQKLNSSITLSKKPDSDNIYNLVANLLTDSGFYEIMNNSLIPQDALSTNSQDEVLLQNPLSNELNAMRQSLLPGALNTVYRNQNRQRSDLRLYEFGKTYRKSDSTYEESRRLCILQTGNRVQESWVEKKDSAQSTIYDLKRVVSKIFKRLGIDSRISYANSSETTLAYGLDILQDKKNLIGFIGSVNAKILKNFDIRNEVFVADFNWDLLIRLCAQTKTEFVPLPKTQFVRRDFSLLLEKGISFTQIQEIASSVEKKLLQDVNLFDVYEGKNLPEGKKSYAVSFIFQDPEKTLQDAQIDKIMGNIREKLETELKAELR